METRVCFALDSDPCADISGSAASCNEQVQRTLARLRDYSIIDSGTVWKAICRTGT
jgi:cytidylate kinase